MNWARVYNQLMIRAIPRGWIPMEDEEWVDRFQGWTLEINPFKDIS